MTPGQVFEEMVAQGDVALDQLDARASDMPDKVYLHYGEDSVRLTFAQVKERSDRIAAGLVAMGLQPGQPVSVLTRNSLVATLAMFAIWRAGGVFAPINFNFRGVLLSYQLEDTAPFALITDPSFAPLLAEVIDRIQLRRLIVHTPAPGDHDHVSGVPADAFRGFEAIDLATLAQTQAPVPRIPRGPFDVANIVYTSGTTGPSKGVVLPFRWINHYGYPTRALTSADDVLYCDLPMYHVGGAFYLVARAVWQGNTVGLWDRFSPGQFWKRIAECGASNCVLLDVMVPWLMSAQERADDRANTLNKVHMQPLPSNHHEVALRFGFDIVTAGFGQTESGAGFVGVIDELGTAQGTPGRIWRGRSKADLLAFCRETGRFVVDGEKPLPRGFMGKPNPLFEVALLDEQDNRVAPGAVGQLAFRPRFPGLILHEYFRKPEATARALRNCWFHTGDACREVPDGNGVHQFVDRMGGFFRVRGENVSSYEVEALIATHPAVRAVAAVPIPAEVGGEDDIVVFVEPRDGMRLTVDEIRVHAEKELPRYMRPRHVRIIDSLPVTATSKVEKYKLKQRILAELDAQRDERAYLDALHELWRRAWPPGTPHEPRYPFGEISLTEYLRRWASTQPDKAAVVYYGRTFTFRELDALSDRMAALLASHGVQRGDRVAVFLPNCPQFHVAFYGILKLGAVHVPVSPMSRAFELDYELKDSGAIAIVALDSLMPVVREVRAAPSLKTVFVTAFADTLPVRPSFAIPDSLLVPRVACPDAVDLMPALDSISGAAPDATVGLDDIAALNYTGGTTGMPKGCIHTQRDMIYTAASNFGIALGLEPDTVFLSFFPQFWIAGENAGLIFHVFSGTTLVLLTRWDPEGVMAAIQQHRVTTMVLPVDGAAELMDHPRCAGYDLRSLRQVRVVSFVKKLNLEYRNRWRALTGTVLAESSWGMTETHTSDTFTTGFQENDFDLSAQPVFVGIPVPGTEFKICDFEAGSLCPLDAEGEILVRSPALLKGYWNQPEATARSIVDGWLRTGDIGLIDSSGFLHYLGRRKEMLKVKGMSVFPPEIEAVLGLHPAVTGSGVVGRQDADRGEVPVAFVQLRPEAGSGTDAHALRAWCASRMAGYKVPEVRIVDQLPMTATGKVKKQDLMNLLERS